MDAQARMFSQPRNDEVRQSIDTAGTGRSKWGGNENAPIFLHWSFIALPQGDVNLNTHV
jgi:hypothetical protein